MVLTVKHEDWRKSSEAILQLAELLKEDVEIKIPGKNPKSYFVSVIYRNNLILDIGFNTEQEAIAWCKNNSDKYNDSYLFLRAYNEKKDDFDVWKFESDMLIGEVEYESI